MVSKRIITGLVGLAFFQAMGLAQGATDTSGFYYKGKSIELLIGAASGGAYDLPGRVVAHHIGRHIPGNPSVVVKNMQGGNSLLMTNYLYNIAPKDGTAFGMPLNSIPLEPLLKVLSPTGDNVKFDIRQFNWIGSIAQEVFVLIAWHTVPVKTIDDLQKTEILTGSTGSLGEAVALPRLLNALGGTKLKIVKGYAGQNDIFLALERGEVQANSTGLTNLASSRAEWLRDKKIRVLVQFTERPARGFESVPTAFALAKTDEDREILRFFLSKNRIARLLMAPPGVMPDRIATLRSAFDATMKDKDFLSESAKMGLPVDPVDGAEVTRIIEKLHETPVTLVERTRSILLSE